MPTKLGGSGWDRAIRQLRDTMAQLDYSDNSIRIYVRLLSGGPMTSTRLRTLTGMDDTSLFNATRTLRRSGLIVRFEVKHENAWYAADPATAWLSMAAEATWSATATLSPIRELPRTGVATIDERSSLCREAALPALTLWTHQMPERNESTSARNAETLAQLAVEAIRIARFHIRSISASPKVSGAAKFWPALVSKLDAGIRYTRLADLNEMYEHGTDVVTRDLKTGVELHIGLQADLASSRGYLADRKVLVRYSEAVPGQSPDKGFLTTDRHAIERFRRRFDRLARTAVPADIALSHLIGLADSLRESATGLSQDAQDWLDELLRMGRFARIHVERNWNEDHRNQVEEELLASEFATWSSYGKFIANWPDSETTTAYLQRTHLG